MSYSEVREQDWTGPVCIDDNGEGQFWSSIAEMREYFGDDSLAEQVFGCSTRGPKLEVEDIIDEDFVQDGEYWPDGVEQWDLAGLQVLLDAWCEAQPKNTWEPMVRVILERSD